MVEGKRVLDVTSSLVSKNDVRLSRPRLHTTTLKSREIVIAKLILSLLISLSFSRSQSRDDGAALITPHGWQRDSSIHQRPLNPPRTFARGKHDSYRSPNSPLFFAHTNRSDVARSACTRIWRRETQTNIFNAFRFRPLLPLPSFRIF